MWEKNLSQIFSAPTEKIEKALEGLPPSAPVQIFSGGRQLEEVEEILQKEGIEHAVQKSPSGTRGVFVPPSEYRLAQELLRQPSKEPKKDLPGGAPRVLGIVGYLRAGKDEVAGYLESSRRGVFRMAYSDPIIMECNDFLEPLGHTIVEANKDSYRALLQEWSMARRKEEEDYWSNLLRKKIERALLGSRMVVLSGARLPADVRLVNEYGGELWRVRRPGRSQSSHPNEAWIDRIPCQATIDNSIEGDITPLYSQIEQILRQYPR